MFQPGKSTGKLSQEGKGEESQRSASTWPSRSAAGDSRPSSTRLLAAGGARLRAPPQRPRCHCHRQRGHILAPCQNRLS